MPTNPGVTGLVAWHEKNEAGGNRADSHTGGLTLTDVNSVGAAPGLVHALAANFVPASSHHLTISTAAYVNTIVSASPWTLGFWMYPEDDPASGRQSPCGNFDGGFTGILPLHKTTATDGNRRVLWQVWSDGASPTGVEAAADAATNAWSFVVLKWDRAAGNLYARTNATTSAAVPWAATLSANSTWYFGRRGVNLSGVQNYFDGRIGPAFLYSRALSSDELDWLYNEGAGRSHADLTATGGIHAHAMAHYRRQRQRSVFA